MWQSVLTWGGILGWIIGSIIVLTAVLSGVAYGLKDVLGMFGEAEWKSSPPSEHSHAIRLKIEYSPSCGLQSVHILY